MQYHPICKLFNLFSTFEMKPNVIWSSGCSITAPMEILEIRESGSQKIAYILWENSPSPQTEISFLYIFSV